MINKICPVCQSRLVGDNDDSNTLILRCYDCQFVGNDDDFK